ncbi:MAG: molybdopterin cofactor-binding domain-containing protein, partial [Nitrososphaerales archaeon]
MKKPPLRAEDLRFLRGSAQYTDDLKPTRQAHLGFVRSPYARALIKTVDLAKAQKNDKFVSALLGEELKSISNPLYSGPGHRVSCRMHLAVGETRFVGEPIVAFLSRDRYALEDIAEDIEVEYEPLPPVVSIAQAKTSKVRVYDHWNDN